MDWRTIFVVLLLLGTLIFAWGCERKPNPPVVPPDVPPVPVGMKAYPPFVVGTTQTLRSPLSIDVRYLPHGCGGGGEPLSYTGAYHPHGAPMEYRYECDWSVFDGRGHKINGQWVRDAVVNLWVGWTEDRPLLPVAPQSCGGNPQSSFTYYARVAGGETVRYTVILGAK